MEPKKELTLECKYEKAVKALQLIAKLEQYSQSSFEAQKCLRKLKVKGKKRLTSP